MAVDTKIIILESYAKSLSGSSASVTTNLCCTKARATALGCSTRSSLSSNRVLPMYEIYVFTGYSVTVTNGGSATIPNAGTAKSITGYSATLYGNYKDCQGNAYTSTVAIITSSNASTYGSFSFTKVSGSTMTLSGSTVSATDVSGSAISYRSVGTVTTTFTANSTYGSVSGSKNITIYQDGTAPVISQFAWNSGPTASETTYTITYGYTTGGAMSITANCSYTITSNSSWLKIGIQTTPTSTSVSGSGTHNGQTGGIIQWLVESNTSGATRTATVTVTSNTYTGVNPTSVTKTCTFIQLTGTKAPQLVSSSITPIGRGPTNPISLSYLTFNVRNPGSSALSISFTSYSGFGFYSSDTATASATNQNWVNLGSIGVTNGTITYTSSNYLTISIPAATTANILFSVQTSTNFPNYSRPAYDYGQSGVFTSYPYFKVKFSITSSEGNVYKTFVYSYSTATSGTYKYISAFTFVISYDTL